MIEMGLLALLFIGLITVDLSFSQTGVTDEA